MFYKKYNYKYALFIDFNIKSLKSSEYKPKLIWSFDSEFNSI